MEKSFRERKREFEESRGGGAGERGKEDEGEMGFK